MRNQKLNIRATALFQLALVTLMLAIAGRAQAQTTINFTIKNLVENRIPIPNDTGLNLQGVTEFTSTTLPTCHIKLQGTAPKQYLDISNTECLQLFNSSPKNDKNSVIEALKRNITFNTSEGSHPNISLTVKGAKEHQFPGSNEIKINSNEPWNIPKNSIISNGPDSVSYLKTQKDHITGRWYTAKLYNNSQYNLDIFEPDAKSISVIVAVDTKDEIEIYDFKITKTAKQKPPQHGTSTIEDSTNNAFEQCIDPMGNSNRYVICVDAFKGGQSSAPEVSGSTGSVHIIKPNTSVLVLLRHASNVRARITMAGQPGLTSLGYQDLTKRENKFAAQDNDADAPPPPASAISKYSFAPRKVGSADIRVQLMDEDKKALFDELLVEILVEQTYIGALRVGIGTVMGGAVDRAYASQRMGGSTQYQLASTTNSVADPELVLGFAPFIFEAFTGGRRYSGDMSFWQRFTRIAPFFGVGLLTQAPTGIDAFKTFYFGGELELAPSFSIAVTGVLRRVTRPAEGLDIGSPLPDENVPTRTGYDLGWAVVVNLTPDFLRLSSSTVSSFLR